MDFKNKKVLTVFSKPELFSLNIDKDILYKDYKRYLITNIMINIYIKKELKKNGNLISEYEFLKENIDYIDIKKENKLKFPIFQPKIDFRDYKINNIKTEKMIPSSKLIDYNKRIRRKKHQLERNFVCQYCKNRYGSNNNMQQHIRLKHVYN